MAAAEPIRVELGNTGLHPSRGVGAADTSPPPSQPSRIPKPTPPRASSGTAARMFGTNWWDEWGTDEACCPLPTVSPPRAPPRSRPSRIPKPTPPRARSGTAARCEEGFRSLGVILVPSTPPRTLTSVSPDTQTAVGGSGSQMPEGAQHTPPSKLRSTAAALRNDLANVTDQLTTAQEKLSGLEQQRLEAETPPHLRCPITLQRMCSPVIVADGHTFERRSIEEWLTRHNTNPLTGATLRNCALVPSLALRDAIRAWEMEHGRSPTPRPPSPRQPLLGGEGSEVEGGENEEPGDLDALEEENAVASAALARPRADAPAVAAAVSTHASRAPPSAQLDAAIHALEQQNNAFASDAASALSARRLARRRSEALGEGDALLRRGREGDDSEGDSESSERHIWSELQARMNERQAQLGTVPGVPLHWPRAGSGAASTDTPAEL